MARVHVFADESGNFDFKRSDGASRYFILTTIALTECSIGDELLELRRELTWKGLGLQTEFHAATDKQAVRDEVFALVSRHDFRIDATILDKTKAQPSVRGTDERFYKMAWYLHFKFIAHRITRPSDELLVVGASVGTRASRAGFHQAVQEVVRQCAHVARHQVASWQCASEPCLQIADYCSWAIQRKWERNDARSHNLIKNKIATEFEPFRHGSTTYY